MQKNSAIHRNVSTTIEESSSSEMINHFNSVARQNGVFNGQFNTISNINSTSTPSSIEELRRARLLFYEQNQSINSENSSTNINNIIQPGEINQTLIDTNLRNIIQPEIPAGSNLLDANLIENHQINWRNLTYYIARGNNDNNNQENLIVQQVYSALERGLNNHSNIDNSILRSRSDNILRRWQENQILINNNPQLNEFDVQSIDTEIEILNNSTSILIDIFMVLGVDTINSLNNLLSSSPMITTRVLYLSFSSLFYIFTNSIFLRVRSTYSIEDYFRNITSRFQRIFLVIRTYAGRISSYIFIENIVNSNNTFISDIRRRTELQNSENLEIVEQNTQNIRNQTQTTRSLFSNFINRISFREYFRDFIILGGIGSAILFTLNRIFPINRRITNISSINDNIQRTNQNITNGSLNELRSALNNLKKPLQNLLEAILNIIFKNNKK